jgi:hypothetical protein
VYTLATISEAYNWKAADMLTYAEGEAELSESVTLYKSAACLELSRVMHAGRRDSSNARAIFANAYASLRHYKEGPAAR